MQPRSKSILAIIGLAAVALVFVGLNDRFNRLIRTQVLPPGAAGSSQTKTFTWTASGALGPRTLTIEATDDKGNKSTKQVTINVLAALPDTAPWVRIESPGRDQKFRPGQAVDVKGHQRWKKSNPITCSDWYLDGQPLPPDAWVANLGPTSQRSCRAGL